MDVNESTGTDSSNEGVEADITAQQSGADSTTRGDAIGAHSPSVAENPVAAMTPASPTAHPARRPGTKTPLFHAMHSERYQRQAVIRHIQEEITQRKLICYVAGSSAQITRNDVLGFNDLLHNVVKGENLDLLLHTPGGDMDAAEKIITMIRNRVNTGYLRVIVPDFAKSAGTLMAIGADEILMSDPSELGPIDPQITLNDAHGNAIPHSIQSYLDAYKAHSDTLKRDPNDATARIMLGKLDPATVKLFEGARDRARTFAEGQLKRRTLRNGRTYTQVAIDLLDTTRWLSHGQMISHADALNLGLNVTYLEPDSDAWQHFWQLYALQRMSIKDGCKLFESDWVSVPMEA